MQPHAHNGPQRHFTAAAPWTKKPGRRRAGAGAGRRHFPVSACVFPHLRPAFRPRTNRPDGAQLRCGGRWLTRWHGHSTCWLCRNMRELGRALRMTRCMHMQCWLSCARKMGGVCRCRAPSAEGFHYTMACGDTYALPGSGPPTNGSHGITTGVNDCA